VEWSDKNHNWNKKMRKILSLFNLFHAHLNSIGIEDKFIIELTLDDEVNAKYRNPWNLVNTSEA
jgi:hypothetical protein